jgi:hypothetical protein
MGCRALLAGLWLPVATHFEMPVSTTDARLLGALTRMLVPSKCLYSGYPMFIPLLVATYFEMPAPPRM